MTLQDAFPVPTTYINKYVWDAMKSLDDSLAGDYKNIVPFFPASDTRSDEWPWKNKPYVIYDQLFRMRRNTRYFDHKIQTLYYIKGAPVDAIVWTNAISHILDREDAVAQDINNWLAANHPDAGVYFHSFKVIQIDQFTDNRMDISLNQQYMATLAVEYEYHLTNQSKFD